MKCRMEENSRLFDVLAALKKGYRTGEFGDLFPFLAEDCVMESQWVMTPNTGYDAVVSYFTHKGKSIADSNSFPECSVVELIGNINPVRNAKVRLNGEAPKPASIGLFYDAGKLCLYMEQTLNGETNGVLADVTLNKEGMVKRIDICMPELFNFRAFYTYVEFFPTTKDWDESDDNASREHLVRVSEPYYGELYLFLSCAGENFDEYGDLRIPMDHWCEALNCWKQFVSAESFDEAFEVIAGVDYKAGTVQNSSAAKQLGRSGKGLWEDRENSRNMVEALIEWTKLYRDSNSFINTCGW